MTNEAKRAYEREWYKRNPEKKKAANNRWELKKREEYRKFKEGLKCIRCGEDHIACLDFHHRDPSEKDGTVSSIARNNSTKKVLLEIEKCDILCANCHRKLHYEWGHNSTG